MPELPEVETVMRGLEPAMQGAMFIRVEQRRADLRFPFPEDFVSQLVGRRVLGLRRRAKYILVDLEGGLTLIMHLGMSGRFTIADTITDEKDADTSVSAIQNEKHEHVVFHLSPTTRIGYSDPRRFGMMDLVDTSKLEEHKFFASLGIEPLGNELSPAYLDQAYAGKATPIKAAMLDQRIVVGLGNIYVCEALFRARISPKRKAASVKGVRTKRLVPIIRDILSEAIEAGGSTLKDFAHTDGELGYFQHRFSVYDREGETCVVEGCDGTIQRIVQSGRSTFYCPNCQR